MKYISFCSGIEAASQAWHSLGWKPLAFCEIDKNASRILAHHYPNVPNLGDFTKVDWSQWSADICVGGTPCQAFSVAGLRKSLSDERGNLSLEFIRAVNIIRPRFVVWENVPGVLSTPDNAFGCFLAGLVGCEEPIVFEQGWPNAGVVDGPLRRCAWRVLDAQYFGLAQRRRRVFVVASSGDGPHPAEILFEWEGMRRDSPPSRQAGEGAAEGAHDGIPGSLCARDSKTVGNQFVNEGKVFPCSVTHSLRADGFDVSEDGTGRGTPLAPVAVMENQRGEMRLSEATDALTKGGGKPGQGYAAAMVPIAFQSNAGAFVNASEDITPTLRIGGDGGNAMAVAIQGTMIGRSENAGPSGSGYDASGSMFTLTKADVHAVACEISDTLGVGANQTTGFKTEVASVGMAVRRLTPRECERLQGFPDGYTAVGVPMAGEASRTKISMADGPRYKALGNSMAVPCMAWIGRRIQQLS